MTLMQYLHTTVYRYYIKQLVTKTAAAFTKRSAIIIEMDFRNPKTLTNMDLRNPKTITNGDMRNPKTITEMDFEIREVV